MDSVASVEILKTVAYAATPILLTVIGWIIKSSLTKLIDKVEHLDKRSTINDLQLDHLTKQMNSVVHLGEEWISMKLEIGQVSLQIKNLNSTLEDVVILKRDQQTIWKRIDELRRQLNEDKSFS